MLYLSIDQLRAGMKVGRSVCDASGRILLAAGTELKESYIERLRHLGFAAIYIWNELAPDAVADDVVSQETRTRMSQELQEVMSSLRTALVEQGRASIRRWRLNTEPIRAAVSAVVDEVLANPLAVVNLQDIRAHDPYTLGHSINVCVLSTLIGAARGYQVGQLRDLGLGAVLHDIGKVAVPEAILNKPGPLSQEEMAEMRRHPEHGYEILRRQPEISLLSAHVAYQHHERWKGGGYPRGIKGTEIHEYARIVAVADVYDAMTADRPYRKGHTPERALRVMREVMSDWFEPDILATFTDHIAYYPVGSIVELQTGEVAVVIEVTRGQADRPRVRVVREPGGGRVRRPYDLDLVRDPSLAVARVIREPEEAGVLPELTGLGDALLI